MILQKLKMHAHPTLTIRSTILMLIMSIEKSCA